MEGKQGTLFVSQNLLKCLKEHLSAVESAKAPAAAGIGEETAAPQFLESAAGYHPSKGYLDSEGKGLKLPPCPLFRATLKLAFLASSSAFLNYLVKASVSLKQRVRLTEFDHPPAEICFAGHLVCSKLIQPLLSQIINFSAEFLDRTVDFFTLSGSSLI